jgi:hypothetical protein
MPELNDRLSALRMSGLCQGERLFRVDSADLSPCAAVIGSIRDGGGEPPLWQCRQRIRYRSSPPLLVLQINGRNVAGTVSSA